MQPTAGRSRPIPVRIDDTLRMPREDMMKKTTKTTVETTTAVERPSFAAPIASTIPAAERRAA
ncbi:hypothetical protein GCM10022256_20940 [Frondihabitans peucedani]|uniref:Uncharacterized protein n=1 Tax=Frondihabitans peucedani TaxID=598626 RepID=A0ABP8E2M2_9MICO